MHLHLLQLGRIPYAEGLRLQNEVVAARKSGAIGDTLLLMEHPPVLTLGRNATRANILAGDELLARKGVEIYETNRGGEVTYHGPGQLVGYPIFDLRGDLPNKRGPFLGPVDFVRLMEEALILTCKDFGVPAQRICKLTVSGPTPAAASRRRRSPPSASTFRRPSHRTASRSTSQPTSATSTGSSPAASPTAASHRSNSSRRKTLCRHLRRPQIAWPRTSAASSTATCSPRILGKRCSR